MVQCSWFNLQCQIPSIIRTYPLLMRHKITALWTLKWRHHPQNSSNPTVDEQTPTYSCHPPLVARRTRNSAVKNLSRPNASAKYLGVGSHDVGNSTEV
jgi:hypothetical protein